MAIIYVLSIIKSAEKASFREAVVQNGVFGESIGPLPPRSQKAENGGLDRWGGSDLQIWAPIFHQACVKPEAKKRGFSKGGFCRIQRHL